MKSRLADGNQDKINPLMSCTGPTRFTTKCLQSTNSFPTIYEKSYSKKILKWANKGGSIIYGETLVFIV